MNTTPIMDDVDALRADMEKLMERNKVLKEALKAMLAMPIMTDATYEECVATIGKAIRALEGSGA